MKTIFVCSQCGAEHRKWRGQCNECKQWNCITEMTQASAAGASGKSQSKSAPLLVQVSTDVTSERITRRLTGIDELDRVFGGGLVPGSVALIGGEPGIGKSTLLLQAGKALAESGHISLYITGEESVAQVRLRGERIDSLNADLHIAAGTDVDAMMASIRTLKPVLVIMDSIQTVASEQLSSAPGTVSQVRDCAALLATQARELGHVLLLVGHVTKDGSIAGPRVLEHMVDTVIYFEGDKGHAHRLLRTIKNRFGPAGEVGVFEMRDNGLHGIAEASRLFLSERATGAPGSLVFASIEGTRPLLLEIQALVAPTVYAAPKRSTVGFDAGRMAMLMAVLERRIGLPLSQQDIYVNVAGGARIVEPAADLAVMLAVYSSFREQPLAQQVAVFGEVGLTGEMRPVNQPELRVREALRFGFSTIILPRANCERVQQAMPENIKSLRAVATIGDAVQQAGL
ncbi:MAG: DNA repair protein RadA [Mariprofundales bacterium]